MKKHLLKFMSVMLTLVITALTVIVPVSAATCDCTNEPIIYLYGKHELYLCDDNGNYILDENGNKILNTANNFDYGEMTKTLLPLFAKGYFSKDWSEFSEALQGYFLPLYEGRGCDGNGDVIDYVHYRNDDKNYVGGSGGATHGYDLGYKAYFNFDYRESPILVAKKFDEFVSQVKAYTGHDKVSVITRCQGTNILMAWLQLYESGEESVWVDEKDMPAVPYESVDHIALLNGCMEGIDSVEELFSGRLDADEDALYRYLGTIDLKSVLGEETGEFVATFIDSLKETYGIVLTADVLKGIYAQFAPDTIPPILRAFYATCGGISALVKDHFDEYIDFVFPTDEIKEEYAGLIEKETYINKNVTTRTAELLSAAAEHGVKVGVYGEYGFQSPPDCPESAYVGDTLVSLSNQTIGATTAKVDGKLSQKYIDAQVEKGLGKYISADGQVDTSTCLFPETTWCFKNMEHEWPNQLHELVLRFIREDITVDDTGAFMNYVRIDIENGVLSPLQEVNENDVKWGTLSDVEQGKATTTILNKIIDFFRALLEKLSEIITEIINTAKA